MITKDTAKVTTAHICKLFFNLERVVFTTGTAGIMVVVFILTGFIILQVKYYKSNQILKMTTIATSGYAPAVRNYPPPNNRVAGRRNLLL